MCEQRIRYRTNLVTFVDDHPELLVMLMLIILSSKLFGQLKLLEKDSISNINRRSSLREENHISFFPMMDTL